MADNDWIWRSGRGFERLSKTTEDVHRGDGLKILGIHLGLPDWGFVSLGCSLKAVEDPFEGTAFLASAESEEAVVLVVEGLTEDEDLGELDFASLYYELGLMLDVVPPAEPLALNIYDLHIASSASDLEGVSEGASGLKIGYFR